MHKALVILSGGQDSTTCLAWAKRQFDQVAAVTFNYGQRHLRELEAAARVARIYDVPHEVVTVGPLLRGRSPLTDHTQALETYTNHEQMESIIGDRVELTFVPMRNAFFLTLGANIAVTQDIKTLVTGVCEADNANYPDCRWAFIDAQQSAINWALGTSDFTIAAPLMHIDKPRTIEMMLRFGMRDFAALAFTHTAYDGSWPPAGKDHASVLRAHGFASLGVPDPLVVRAVMESAMDWPETDNYRHPHVQQIINDVTQHILTLSSELGGVKG